MAKRVVILGGGPAGYEAALTGARFGAEITLVENRGVGGAAVIADCVPSKSFIAGANIKTDLRRAEDMGLDQLSYNNEIDIHALNERVRSLAAEQSADIRRGLDEAGVRVIDGVGALADEGASSAVHAVRVEPNGGEPETLEADYVVVATGAQPRILPGAKPDGERVLTWQQIYNLDELPSHLVVVGSGVTGAEFVSAFAELGVKVTMVASRGRILPYDDADAADVLEQVLGDRGVSLEKDARVDTVENTGDGVVVRTNDGREITGSHALMTVGSVPHTEGIGLTEAGVELTRSGHIHVDRVSRTNVPGIYAAGDCTDLFPLASVAAMQGRIAMHHALGESVSALRLKTVGTAVFTRPEIATVGVTQKELEEDPTQAVRTIMLPLSSNPRAKMRSLRYGFVKLFSRKNSGRVIGGVVVAPVASELILPIALAVTNNLTVSEVARTFAVYPSLSGTITDAARQLVGPDELE